MDRSVGSPPLRRRSSSTACNQLRRLGTEGGWTELSSSEQPPDPYALSLDDKTRALVRLGALIATTAGPTAYKRIVDAALAAGATTEEVIATLIAVAPTVGLAHLVAATIGLAHGLGYDIDAALESLDVP